MPHLDGYTARNLAMFLYPIYGYFIYKNFCWPKAVKWIAIALVVYLFYHTICSNRSAVTGLLAMSLFLVINIKNQYLQKAVWILTFCVLLTFPSYVLKGMINIHKTIINYKQFKTNEKLVNCKQVNKDEKLVIYKPQPIVPKAYAPTHASSYGPVTEDTKINNTIFRLFIWQDMIEELWQNKAIFGMGLSHPLRSKQLEMLHWAESEWGRDGWISAHNSYLYVIYRTGILGVMALGWLLFKLWMAYKRFKQINDTIGLLLCSCLVYWLVTALTMLQLELPYYAIPFWAIIGLTFRRDYDNQRINMCV